MAKKQKVKVRSTKCGQVYRRYEDLSPREQQEVHEAMQKRAMKKGRS
jgi:hypothetical protein